MSTDTTFVRNEIFKANAMRQIKKSVTNTLLIGIEYALRYLKYPESFDKTTSCKFIDKSFPRWVFNSNLHGNVNKFVVNKLEVEENDLKYHISVVLRKDLTELLDKIPEIVDFDKIQKNIDAVNRNLRELMQTDGYTKVDHCFNLSMNSSYVRIFQTVTLWDRKRKNNHRDLRNDVIRSKRSYLLSTLPKSRIDIIREKYFKRNPENGTEQLFVNLLGALCSRYKVLGGGGLHGSIPSDIINYISKNSNFKDSTLDSTIEMFGTPFNTTTDKFCSPFYDLEQYFGSLGNFANYEFANDTTYIVNPPFDELIMSFTSKKITTAMRNNTNITFVYVLPVWDTNSQADSSIPDRGLKLEALEILLASEYIRQHETISREDHVYYDTFRDIYMNITPTHLVVLSNRENTGIDLTKVTAEWISLSKNKKI